MLTRAAFAILFSTLFIHTARADTVVIDFENLSDSTVVGSNYSAQGVIFSNAVVLTAGISLNDSDFPPHSGSNVAFDVLGPITLIFLTPVSSFSAFFTYSSPLTLDGFDPSNSMVASASSAFGQNFVSSGNSPNEMIQLDSAGGISSVTITGDPGGTSFAMDDVTFTTLPITTPEPGTALLLALGSICVIRFRDTFASKF